MINRRTVLASSAALLTQLAIPRRATAAGRLRVASLKFGSLSWLLATIKAEGLDAKAGLDIEVREVASNQAGPVALMAGDADIIVSDWTWAMRQRGLGNALRFAPYSSALGALMVPKDSGLTALNDLAGKRLGVAGSAIDKSWLLLRAYSRKTTGKDISEVARPQFGAAPLITEELRNGRIDAALNFWTYAARLSSDGFVQLVSMAEIMTALGVEPPPPMVGYIWNEKTEFERTAELKAFIAVAAAANDVLAQSDAAWDRLRPLVKPANDAEMSSIKAFYRSGIPGPWTSAQTRSAEKLMALLVELGDQELVGAGTQFEPKLFHAAGE